VSATKQVFNFRYRSPDHLLEIFRTYYGPMNRAFAALDAAGHAALERDLRDLLARMGSGGDSLVVPSEYLEAVVTRR
jgi:hypothetical protein